MTDVGEFAKSELTITPAANGSYLVRRNASYFNDSDRYLINEMACFTNYSDLLNFLCTEYNAANRSGASNPADFNYPPA
jgi:hypothetical protein